MAHGNPDHPCSVENCDRRTQARGYCGTHYRRWLDSGDPGGSIHGRARRVPGETCQEDCDRPVLAKGLCGAHYRRQRVGAPSDAPVRPYAGPGNVCRVEDCERAVAAHGVCNTHYARLRRWGDPEAGYEPKGHVTKQGYRLAYAPDHPMAQRNGHVMEHRLVMALKLGRSLQRREQVHHVNGQRLDNGIENLELWVKLPQPPGQRARDLVEWARQIEAQYGAEYDRGLL